MKRAVFAAAWAVLSLGAGSSRAVNTITFDDFPLAADSYWNGSDSSGGFASGGAHFNNAYDTTYHSWSGFAYSNILNPSTPGFSNQYAVAGAGTGMGGAGNYAVVYDSSWDEQDIVTFAAPETVVGFYVNNTAYAALDMLYGSGFSKAFGGPSGDDPDWFLLSVTGRDAGGGAVGTAEAYLADFRSSDPAQDFILTAWTWVDLSGLGAGVSSLHFALSSSDQGTWGMNTPAYFAMDNLQLLPEPGTGLFLLAGVAAMAMRRSCRRLAERRRARGPS